MQKQAGRCYYCNQPTWQSNDADFAKQHRLSPKQAHRHKATAEHLLARSDGGQDSLDNIVMACRYCNGHRHVSPRPKAPGEYRVHVQRRLVKGRWHGFMPVSRS